MIALIALFGTPIVYLFTFDHGLLRNAYQSELSKRLGAPVTIVSLVDPIRYHS